MSTWSSIYTVRRICTLSVIAALSAGSMVWLVEPDLRQLAVCLLIGGGGLAAGILLNIRQATDASNVRSKGHEIRMGDDVSNSVGSGRNSKEFRADKGSELVITEPTPVSPIVSRGPEPQVEGEVDEPTLESPTNAQNPGPTTCEPAVLGAMSAAGQAPWLLPIRASPAGICADAGRIGGLEVRAASVVGPGHRCETPVSPRQDAYALSSSRDGRYLIVAVADGLSQSCRSDLGARIAVSAASRIITEALDDGDSPAGIDAKYLFRSIAGEMVGTGRSRGLGDEALCSVLAVAVIPTAPRESRDRVIWTAQIGDVSLWSNGDREWCRLTGATKSGLDRNKVDAVLPHNWAEVVITEVTLAADHSIAIMTDGLSDTLDDIAGSREFFDQVWGTRPPHIAQFILDMCYDATGQTDDRTAVVVWTRANGDER